MFTRPRRMTPPFNLFFHRRALPPPPPILPPVPPLLPRRFATPPLPFRKPPGPGPFPQTPSPSDTIWTKKFVAKLCFTNVSIFSTELLISQRLRLKLADDQERMVAASELALGERHEEIAKKLQKLIEFEEEKKKEREYARKALECKVAEKGKIVKDLGSAADTLP